eukprot:PhM_4_TR18626/c3_g2_i3/m.27288
MFLKTPTFSCSNKACFLENLTRNFEVTCVVFSLLQRDSMFSTGKLEPWKIRTACNTWNTVSHYPGNDATNVKPTGEDTLYIPQSSTFPVVDAIIVSASGAATLVQVTIANDHKPKSDNVDDLFKKLANNGLNIESIVWIVDTGSGLKTTQGTVGDTN